MPTENNPPGMWHRPPPASRLTLSDAKREAHDAEAQWQQLRTRTLQRLGPGELLFDCAYCFRVTVVLNKPPRALWFCPCSPRNGQRAVSPRR